METAENSSVKDVSVAFIIPHKGRLELLNTTLRSIANLDLDLKNGPGSIHVYLVTQNSGLSSTQLEIQPNLITVLEKPESLTISALRNCGVAASKSDYLAFLDADVELSRNWLKDLIPLLQDDPNRLLVSAFQANGPNAPPLEKIRTALSNVSLDSNVQFLPGRNLLLTRDTFERVGGFPEHLVTCEDYYFTGEVNKLGDVFYTTRSSYVHLGEDKALDEMYKKEIWRGQSNLLSLKGRDVPLSELPSFIVPIWILFFFLVAIISVLLLRIDLSLLFVFLALLPILAYSFRLYRKVPPEVGLVHVLKFYLTYFPARIVGTIIGLFKTIRVGGH